MKTRLRYNRNRVTFDKKPVTVEKLEAVPLRLAVDWEFRPQSPFYTDGSAARNAD